MRLSAILKATIAAIPFVFSFSQAALAETELGGINVAEYCLIKYGGEAFVRPPAGQRSGNAYSWQCRVESNGVGIPLGFQQNFTLYGISMNEACRMQYRDDSAYSRPVDPSSPYTWRCYK